MCTITTQTTSYTPYYLLYGQNLMFGFDIADHTWAALDWYTVKDISNLLALWLKQITHWNFDFTDMFDWLYKVRKKAIKDYEKWYRGRVPVEMLATETLMLMH